MHLGGLDVQHALLAGGAGAACLLCDEAHGGALVQQAQLAILVLGVTGVAVDASVQHGAVEVTHLQGQEGRLTGQKGNIVEASDTSLAKARCPAQTCMRVCAAALP